MLQYFQKYIVLITYLKLHIFLPITFFLSIILTFLVKKIAIKFNIVDVPNKRKVHLFPIPVLGGVAIFWTFLLAIIGFNFFIRKGVFFENKEFIAVLIASFFIHIVGVYDDIKNMKPLAKLLCQIFAALIVVISGVQTTFIFHIKILNIIFSIGWIVLLTNSFNLLDNMDGLSCGIATITLIIFGLTQIMQGDYILAVFIFILAFSCLGFLIFNFSPASIFMGDGGSMFLGFIISVISIQCSYLTNTLLTRLPILIPILVLFIPLYDTFSVMFIRIKLSQSIFKADKRHFSHRLVNLGIKPKYAVLIIYMATFSTGLTATLLTKLELIQAIIVLVSITMIFGIIAILEWFGFKKYEQDI